MKAVGEAKGSSASAQWAAAVIGAALSSVTGGDAQSGASIAANAIKNNHLDAEIAAQEGQPAKEVVKNDENLISSYYYDEINLTPDQTDRLKVLDEYGGANGKAAVIQASYVSYITNLHTDVSLSRLEKNSKGAK